MPARAPSSLMLTVVMTAARAAFHNQRSRISGASDAGLAAPSSNAT
jgi:hypothetical protein